MGVVEPLSADETMRLEILAEYQVLDTPPENDFDRIVSLAARIFDVPMVLISLVDRERQFFKARVGFDVCETTRDVSFCAHAIRGEDILFIPDASLDPRFADNPLVLGPPSLRFYAGKPLVAPSGERLGTLCVLDNKPRAFFGAQDRATLTDLAALVMERMESRRVDHGRAVSQVRFESIAATSPDAIICSNAHGEITFWNPAAERLFGYTADEVLAHSPDIIIAEEWRELYGQELGLLRADICRERTVELAGRRKDGREFPAAFSLATWREGDTISFGVIVRDISERRQHEQRLCNLASLDSLTLLSNRAVWRESLERVHQAGEPATVLLLDLDGFKNVNDTCGHADGDLLLKDVSRRLREVCPEAITLARIGGDEFAILLSGNDTRAATDIANQLVVAISEPYEVGFQDARIGVSIGVALMPQHGSGPEEVLGAADLALQRAKAAGKGCHELFEPQLRERAVARREFERELRVAFENNEFELFYQPQVSVTDGRLIGAEALMRWNHPQRGLLTPVFFMDVLSQKPSATAVGEWVMRTACRQAAQWRRHVPDFRIGVNLFDAQFRTGRLLASVREALAQSGLPAAALELEILETVLLRSDASTLRLLRDLRAMGVGLAFDDYGTGFASLSLLKRYPVSRLKIDRSFVSNVNTDRENAALVSAVLYLGRSFGLDVIAEGVETAEQVEFLRENQCFSAQGYLFGRPVPAAEFTRRFVPGP